MGLFVRWADATHREGLADVFDHTRVDYPAFPIILWPIAEAYGPFVQEPATTDDTLYRLVKIPGVLGDLAVVVAVFWVARRLLAQLSPEHQAHLEIVERLPLLRSARIATVDKAALFAASLWALNPAVIYDSAYWGQIDSLIALAMLGSVAAVLERRPGLAGFASAVGFAIKPQPIVVAPVIAIAIIQRFGVSGVLRAALGVIAGLVLTLGYFVVHGHLGDIWDIYARLSQLREHVSYNAWNIWWPAEAFGDPVPGDVLPSVAGVRFTYELVSVLLLTPVTIATMAFVWYRRDNIAPLLAASLSILSFFMLATAVHERYLIYVVALLAPMAVLGRRWLAVYAALSVTVLLNLSASLPPHEAWGDLVNGAPFSLLMASTNVLLYLFCFSLILVAPASGSFDVRETMSLILQMRRASQI